MLEFSGGIALGMNVGNFLELECAFECDRETGAPTEVENIACLGEVLCQPLDLRLKRKRCRHHARRLDESMYQLLLFGRRQNAACVASRNGKTGKRAELTGERLGRRHTDFRPR